MRGFAVVIPVPASRSVRALRLRLALLVALGGGVGPTGAAPDETAPSVEPATADLAADEPGALTLRSAIALALANNRTLLKAGLDRDVQRYDLRVAQDEFAPDLALTSTGSLNPVRESGARSTTTTGRAGAVLSQRLPTGARLALAWDSIATDDTANANPVYDSALSLQLTQPLLRGAGTRTGLATLRIARFTEQGAALEYRRLLIATVTQVIVGYRSLLLAQRSVEINQRAVELAREQLRINRALVEAGILPPVEIVQSEADIASREFDLLTAQGSRDAARFNLVRVLDVAPDEPVFPAEPIVLPEFALETETCRRLAYENRPDYRQTILARDTAGLALGVARNGLRWDLALTSRYRLDGSAPGYGDAVDATFSRRDEDWFTALTLQVPLGDLTRRQGYVRALGRARKAEVDVTEVTENLELEIADALRSITLGRERVRAAGLARELANRKLEIEKGRLQAGRTSNFAIVTFQNDLVRARLNELSAQITYLNALTFLDQTLGITLLQWGIQVIDADATGPARAFAREPENILAPAAGADAGSGGAAVGAAPTQVPAVLAPMTPLPPAP